MQYILLLYCLTVVLYYSMKRESLFNPVYFFCAIWLFIIFLSTLHLYGVNESSSRAYFIAMIGTVSFTIGGAFRGKRKIIVRKREIMPTHPNNEIAQNTTYTINSTLITVIGTLTLIVYLVQLFPVLRMYALGSSMQTVRQLYASGSYAYDIGGPVFAVLVQYIAQPFVTAIMPLSLISVFVLKNKRKGLLVLGITLVLLQLLIDTGRAIIVQYAFYFIFIFIISSGKHRIGTRITAKQKKYIILIVVACVIALAFLSNLRGVNDLYKSIYLYISGCMPYMDARLDAVDAGGFFSMGAASLFGVTSIVRFMLSIIGINPTFLVKVSEVSSVQEILLISKSDIYMNAFVSPFYHLYQDGRWLGVIIGMLIYGYVSMSCYKAIKNQPNPRNIYLYSILLVGILFSMVRIPFAKTNYVLSLAFALFLFKRRNIKAYNTIPQGWHL